MSKAKQWVARITLVILIVPVLSGIALSGTVLADTESVKTEQADSSATPAMETEDPDGPDDVEWDDGGGDDPFDAIDTSIPESAEIQTEKGSFRVGGFVKLESEYGFNKTDEKLSRLTPQLFIETEVKINDNYKTKVSGQFFYDLSYDLEAKDKHDGFSQDDEPYDGELKDAYVDGRLSDRFSIRAGRQIMAWGVSDYARITDVINPRDLTSPGLIDLEDARLPVAALRFTAAMDAWTIETASIHEHPGSKVSGIGADFDYYKSLRSPAVSINDKDTPDVDPKNTGIAVKANYGFNGGDLSFMASRTFDDQPYLQYDGLNGSVMTFTPQYDRVTTLGMSSSLVKGSALFKVESAFRHDRKIMRNDVVTQISSGVFEADVKTTSQEDQVAALVGVEYTGFSDLRLSFETQMIYTLDRPDYLSVDETQFMTYLQATKDLLNETLELDLFWATMNPGHGNILRLSGTYDFFDGFQAQAGVAFYAADKSSSTLYPYKDQDRIFIRFKYSF